MNLLFHGEKIGAPFFLQEFHTKKINSPAFFLVRTINKKKKLFLLAVARKKI
jgi:hypothetical protein